MALIRVNPEAEAGTNFESVKAGKYRMRVKEIKDRNPEKNDLEVKLEHVLPVQELLNAAGQPIKGQAAGVFDYIMLAEDKQWKLRQITESAGLPWGDFDPTLDLLGKEVDVMIKIEMYEGEPRNKVAKYIAQK